jgi:hypothetical protein
MSFPLLSVRYAVQTLLASCLVAGTCACDKVGLTGTIVGTIPPVAGVGSATSVRATAADGTVYTAAPDALTGKFSFALPPGTYLLSFITTLSAPDTFPGQVPVTVAAGATATPTLPPLTHDNIKRGLLRWTVGGNPYTATSLVGQFNDRGLFSASKGYFYLTGRAGEIDKSPEVADVSLVLPEASRKGVIFVGPATYTLGGDELGSFGEYTYYVGGRLSGFSRYTTPMYTSAPSGTLRLTRFDANLGVATGTFEFVATASANAAGERTLTQGEFDITF